MGKAIRMSEDEVVVSRRGRVATFDNDLLEDLESITEGEALDLTPYFDVVDKEDRQKVGAEIRKHWKAVYGGTDNLRIDFGNGRPQVRLK